MKIYLIYILMVAMLMFFCFFGKYDYSETETNQPPRVFVMYPSTAQNQGSREITTYWNTGVTYNVTSDSVKAQALEEKVQQEANYSSAKPGLPSLESEPLNVKRFAYQLAEHHAGIIEKGSWKPIKFVTYEDSIMSSIFPGGSKISWIRR